MLFKLLCDPGDEVLTPTPSYPLFDYLAALESVTTTLYRLQYDGVWHIDFADLRRRISHRTRAIVLVNPNNPTGTFLTRAEQDELMSIALEYQLPLICDEVFMDYGVCARSGVCRTLIGCDDVVSFSLNGLSKAAGMPQVKLSWIVINGPAKDRQLARDRLELISDTYLSVATPVQKALKSLLEIGEQFQSEIAARLRENLQQIDKTLAGTPASRLHMDGGWSAILQVPGTRSDEVWAKKLLLEKQVLVQPGYYFDLTSGTYLVVSLLTEPATLHDGAVRIADCCSTVS